MNIKIVSKIEKPLLSRNEISGEIDFSGPTPSKATLKKKLVEQLKTSEDMLVIKHIFTRFGEGKATFLAYHYTNKEDMNAIEPKQKKTKKEKPVEQKKDEQKAEAPSESPKKTPSAAKTKNKE